MDSSANPGGGGGERARPTPPLPPNSRNSAKFAQICQTNIGERLLQFFLSCGCHEFDLL